MSTPRPNLATRFARLDMGQVRDAHRNEGTIVAGTDPLLARAAIPYETLFFAHYAAIRELAAREAPGAAMIAVHAPTGALAGQLWLRRKPDRPNAAIVGRHSECDLVLDHGSLSLRHVALVVPRVDGGTPRFWVRELRTGGGLDSVQGTPVGGALVEGAGLFRAGGYALIAFATGRGTGGAWPVRAQDAWAALHQRATGPRVIPMDPGLPPRPRLEASPAPSVSVIRGPLKTSEALLEPGGVRACTLRIDSEGHRARLALDEAALGRGVLLGRYARCDSGAVLRIEEISRVHLLVVRVEEDLVAIDTASTQGTYLEPDAPQRAHVVVLSKGEVAHLGRHLAAVRVA